MSGSLIVLWLSQEAKHSLICCETIAVLKECDISLHYETNTRVRVQTIYWRA
jgi:hypothetical protein